MKRIEMIIFLLVVMAFTQYAVTTMILLGSTKTNVERILGASK